MREEEAMKEHGAESMPTQDAPESEFDEEPISEIILELFRRSATYRPQDKPSYDTREALAALERISGCISHGALAQNIDDELYGPME